MAVSHIRRLDPATTKNDVLDKLLRGCNLLECNLMQDTDPQRNDHTTIHTNARSETNTCVLRPMQFVSSWAMFRNWVSWLWYDLFSCILYLVVLKSNLLERETIQTWLKEITMMHGQVFKEDYMDAWMLPLPSLKPDGWW